MLSIHRYLSALAIAFVVVHVVAILADGFVALRRRRRARADGLVVAPARGGLGHRRHVRAARRSRSPRWPVTGCRQRVWRGIHMLSYVLLALVTVHLLTAGTDANDLLPTVSAVLIGVATVFGCAMLLTWRTAPRVRPDAERPGSGYQPVTWPGDQPVHRWLRARRVAARDSARSGSTSSSSAAASPGRASRSTPPAADCAPRWWSGTTSPPAPARRARSSCTAACATCSSASSASSTRRSTNGSGRSRTRRTSCGCSRSSSRCWPGAGVIDRRLARVLGTALWMYDLTGGLRIGKRHHRDPGRRRARAHAHARP